MTKFKVGDRVRFLRSPSPFCPPLVGATARIVRAAFGIYEVAMDEAHSARREGELLYARDADLEPAAPAEDPALAYLKREIAASAAAGSNKPGSFLFERHDELARMLREVYGLQLSTEPQFVPVSAQ